MKKIIASVGLVAVGAASLQAAYAPGLDSMQTTKMWSVTGTLRGFYDDNINSSQANKRQSFGFEVSPSFSLNVPLQQTVLGLRYTYGLYYYDDRESQGMNPIDQTHQVDLWIDHAFSERWQMKVQDSFVSAQDPSLVNGGTVNRANGNNIRNVGTATLHTDWTRLLGSELGYRNTYVNYQNSGGSAVAPSLSGLLDRIENLAWLNFSWQAKPEMSLFVGYQYGQVDYIGNEPVALTPAPVNSSVRNNRSHYGYLGAEHAFLPNLKLSARGGVQYTDYYNDPTGTTSVSPYVDLSLTYTYRPGSYMQVGFNQSRNGTDVIAPDASGKVTLDQETSTVFASINHHITPKLLGSLVGRFQYSTFEGGLYDGQSDAVYSAGANLSYSFNPHFSAEVGYNYDTLTSNLPGRDYSRNRVYLGVSATY